MGLWRGTGREGLEVGVASLILRLSTYIPTTLPNCANTILQVMEGWVDEASC